MKIVVEDACNRGRGTGYDKAIIQVTLHTKLSSVINEYCDQRGITQKREYVLVNDKGEVLDDNASVSACAVLDEDVLYLTPKYKDDSVTFGLSNYVFLAAIALIIGVAGITAVTILYVRDKTKPGPYDYGLVFDAGSTHTQLYVYQWSMPKVNNSGDVKQIATAKCAGQGINKYTVDPSEAGRSISTCLQSVQNSIPPAYERYTPVYLGATAGMRLLHEANSSASEAILSSIRSALARGPYEFSSPSVGARIISGQEEGTFSWLTANYLLHSLNTDRIGALDMGGASTQITYVPGDGGTHLPSEYRDEVVVHGRHYTVYTHSYLCYGKQEAERRHAAQLILQGSVDPESSNTITNPCLALGASVNESAEEIFKIPCVQKQYPAIHHSPIGPQEGSYTFSGSSNVTACYESVSRLFNFTSCLGLTNCTFNHVTQPPLQGHYYAFSSFYYTMEFLNMTSPGLTLTQVKDGIDTFCSLPFSKIKDMAPEKYLLTYCFDAVYIYTLLVHGYKFNDTNWDTLTFTNNVSSSELGWSLGFMLNETNVIAEEVPRGVTPELSTLAYSLLITLFIVFLLIFAVFAFYTVSQRPRRTHRRRDYSRLQEPGPGAVYGAA